jgi:hypothetical protein
MLSMISIARLSGGTCGDRTHLVLIKSQVPLRFGIGSELGAGVEDRTLLIFFVGEVPSPDDNPGVVPSPAIEQRRNRTTADAAYKTAALPLRYWGINLLLLRQR